MEKDELWQNVLADVELNTSRATFNTWFGGTNIQSIEDNILLISVPNSFAKEWLENKFNKFILKSIRNFLPEIKDIKFIISPIRWVADNIIRNTLKFLFVADNAVVKTRLPPEILADLPGIDGTNAFVLIHDHP